MRILPSASSLYGRPVSSSHRCQIAYSRSLSLQGQQSPTVTHTDAVSLHRSGTAASFTTVPGIIAAVPQQLIIEAAKVLCVLPRKIISRENPTDQIYRFSGHIIFVFRRWCHIGQQCKFIDLSYVASPGDCTLFFRSSSSASISSGIRYL